MSASAGSQGRSGPGMRVMIQASQSEQAMPGDQIDGEVNGITGDLG